MRYKWGNQTVTEASRFIDELDFQFVEDEAGCFEEDDPIKPTDFASERKSWTTTSFSKPKEKRPDISKLKKIRASGGGSMATADFSKIQPGVSVYHQRFGKGKVIQIEGEGADTKALVFFNNVGKKKLILKFAKLEIEKD